MALETTRFDPAKHIRTPDAIAELLNDALSEGDAGYFAMALGVAARSKGVGEIAERAGLNRQALYRSLGKGGNPTMKTVFAVLGELGLRLEVGRGD